jgi:formylglycine-generating enzyme required for sulfatase activity
MNPHGKCAAIIAAIILAPALAWPVDLSPKSPGDNPSSGETTSPAVENTPNGALGIQWVRISSGSFLMGSAGHDEGLIVSAKPAHHVAVKAFEIMKTLVTNKQYRACIAAGACAATHASDGTCDEFDKLGDLPSSFQDDDKPVVCVDWDQANVFSAWINGRLPSEAEWEYAARSAGKKNKYPWGNKSWSCERANDGFSCPNSHHTTPVCAKPKGNTEQGLCDMAGNVMQWTLDWSHNGYYGAPNDGSAADNPPNDQESQGRIIRGSQAEFGSIVAFRMNRAPSVSSRNIGFRAVRSR